MTTKTGKAKLAREIVAQNPSITANRALAKILLNKYPMIFNDLEDARGFIRYAMEKHGEKYKTKVGEAFLERLARLRAEHQFEVREQEDKTPYKFNKNYNKALVISDLHIPFLSIDALDLALEYGYKRNADCIIVNGDFLDFSTISRFTSKPNEMRVIEQIENGIEVLKYLQSALGVKVVYHEGNHCYSADTKVLTKSRGFVLFSELTSEDEVAQFDGGMNISYSKPINVLSRMYKGDLYTIENSYSKQKVTDLHDVVVDSVKKKAKDVTLDDLKKIPTSGCSQIEDYPINDDYLRLIVNIVCDATLVDNRKYNPKSKKRRVQFKLSKQRKIDHLEDVLTKLNLPYSKKECKKTGINILQPYYIRIYGEPAREIFATLNDKKKFPDFFRLLSRRQMQVVFDELCITDGSIQDKGLVLTTTSKEDAELLLSCFVNNGFIAKFKKNSAHKSGFKNGSDQYLLKVKGLDSQFRYLNKNGESLSVSEYDGMVYCVEMPLGTVVTMVDGKVAFSGNCNRIEQYMIRQAPELYYLNKLEKLLHLEELGVDFVSGVRICSLVT